MIRLPAIALLFFMLSSFLPQEDAREYFKFAKFNYDSKNYEKALQYINKALKADPGYENAFILRAEIYYELHQYTDAIADITEVINREDNTSVMLAGPYLLRGKSNYALNKIPEAIRDIKSSLALDKNNAQAYYMLGKIQYDDDRLFESLENLDKAITLDPDNAEYYYFRSRVKMEHYKPIPGTKTYDNIMADIKVAMALKPDDFRPYELKCKMLKLKLENDKEVYISELSNAIKLFPDQAEFYAQRGMARVLDYDFSNALADFTKAIELDPENEVNYRNRGLCLHNINKYARAIDDYTIAIDLMIRKYQKSQSKQDKKLLAETLVMRGRTYMAMRNNGNACLDFYNAAKLGSKTGLNNYRKNCNVYE